MAPPCTICWLVARILCRQGAELPLRRYYDMIPTSMLLTYKAVFESCGLGQKAYFLETADWVRRLASYQGKLNKKVIFILWRLPSWLLIKCQVFASSYRSRLQIHRPPEEFESLLSLLNPLDIFNNSIDLITNKRELTVPLDLVYRISTAERELG